MTAKVQTLILFFLLLSTHLCFSQADSTFFNDQDTIEYSDDSEDDVEEVLSAPADSVSVNHREFQASQLEKLRSDPSLNYKEPPSRGKTLWRWFLLMIIQFISDILNTAVTTNWGRLILYGIGLAVLVAVVMMILKVDAFKVLYSGQGGTRYQVFTENIHEMNFDALLQEALGRKDYRAAIRLLFLQALKLLSDHQHIHWQSGKTNHEYLAELRDSELKKEFNELSFYFDYTWYGNFPVNNDTFVKVESVFKDLKAELNR